VETRHQSVTDVIVSNDKLHLPICNQYNIFYFKNDNIIFILKVLDSFLSHVRMLTERFRYTILIRMSVYPMELPGVWDDEDAM